MSVAVVISRSKPLKLMMRNSPHVRCTLLKLSCNFENSHRDSVASKKFARILPSSGKKKRFLSDRIINSLKGIIAYVSLFVGNE